MFCGHFLSSHHPGSQVAVAKQMTDWSRSMVDLPSRKQMAIKSGMWIIMDPIFIFLVVAYMSLYIYWLYPRGEKTSINRAPDEPHLQLQKARLRNSATGCDPHWLQRLATQTPQRCSCQLKLCLELMLDEEKNLGDEQGVLSSFQGCWSWYSFLPTCCCGKQTQLY